MHHNRILSSILTVSLLLALFPAALSEEAAPEAAVFIEVAEDDEEVVASAPVEDAVDEIALELDDAPIDDAPTALPDDASESPAEDDGLPAGDGAEAVEATVGKAGGADEPTPEPLFEAEPEGSSDGESGAGDSATDDAPAEPVIPEVELAGDLTIRFDMQSRFRIALVDAAAKKYATSDKKIAKVDGSGLVSTLKAGKVKITVTLTNGKKRVLTINVIDPTMPTSVALAAEDGTPLNAAEALTLNFRETLKLVPCPEPAATAQTTYTWATSNKKIATVNAEGVVSPVKEGTARITVTTKRGGRKATVTVKVVDPIKADAIRLETEDERLAAVGASLDPNGAIALPLRASLPLIPVTDPVDATSWQTWSTGNAKLATVSRDGVVTAKAKEGTTTITVATSTGKKAAVKVRVFDPARPTRVTLDHTGTETLNYGETLALTPTILPETAVKDLSWSTSNKKVAVVSAEGVVTAKAREGTVTITATSRKDKKKKASLKVRVVDPNKPTSIALDATGTTTLEMPNTLTLTPTILPETANRAVTWSTSNAKVAKVDANGVVTPVKVGKAVITVTTKVNKRKASVTVNVVDPIPATGIGLDRSGMVELPMNRGPLALNALPAPADATSMLTWSTSSAKIATVNAAGEVTPVKPGIATITVATSNGKKASVKIQVVGDVVPATGLIPEWSFADEDNVVEMGELYETAVSLRPANGRADITWTSSDEAVARIKSTDGAYGAYCPVSIEPVAPGEAIITASIDGVARSFKLTVIPRIVPEYIVFSTDGPVTVKVKKTVKVTYDVLPGDSILKPENCATFISSNPAVATVSGRTDNGYKDCRGAQDYTLTITGKSPGTATITVTLANNVSESLEVVVTK